MLAYTGVETVSNLAEEARDPARNVPNAYKLVAGAVFAIYFTLPLDRALGAAGRASVDGEYETLLGLPPEEGGYANDPVLGVVENLGLEGWVLDGARDLRRRPRRDDPLHRHERRRDRRLADHVLDGELPAAAGGVPPAAPALQDAVARARRLRRDRADRRHAAGRRRLSSGRCTRSARRCRSRSRTRRSSRCAPRARRRARLPRATEPARRARRLAALRARRRARDRDLVARDRRAERARRAGPGSAGSRSGSRLRRLPAPVVHESLPRPCARPRSCSARRSTLEYRTIVVPVVRSASRRRRSSGARLAAERGATIVDRCTCSRCRSTGRSTPTWARSRTRRRPARRRAGARRGVRRARRHAARPRALDAARDRRRGDARNAELIVIGRAARPRDGPRSSGGRPTTC